MRIVFGWNNFKIKSFDPYELGLTSAPTNEFSIEARQSYFHLFWIPCFGLGKKWNIRKGADLYELPAAYHEIIRTQKVKIRSPWYTFTLPLLLVLGVVVSSIYASYDTMRRYTNNVNEYAEKTTALTNQLNNLNTRDIISVNSISGQSKKSYLKVERISAASYTLTVIETPEDEYRETPTYIEGYYLQNKELLDTIVLTKAQLLNAYARDYETSNTQKRPRLSLNSSKEKFEITEVTRHFGPIIKDRYTGGFGMGSLYMEFLNEGWPATITEIKNLENNIKWTDELPKDTGGEHSTTFSLNGQCKDNTPYKFQLTMKDTSGKEYKYIIAGKNLEKTITQVD